MSHRYDDLAVLQRRTKVAALYLAGTTQQYRIAEALGLPLPSGQRVVSRDLEAIRKAWRESATASYQDHVAAELARLEAIEAEGWQAWRESKAGRTASRSRKRTAPGGADGGSEGELSRQSSPGDAAFLVALVKVSARRAALLGLDAPTRVQAEVRDAPRLPFFVEVPVDPDADRRPDDGAPVNGAAPPAAAAAPEPPPAPGVPPWVPPGPPPPPPIDTQPRPRDVGGPSSGGFSWGR
jgi:hypothetical protein